MCQLIAQLHQQVTAEGPTTVDRVLRWDCLYQAVGLGCYSLPQHLDFCAQASALPVAGSTVETAPLWLFFFLRLRWASA